MVNRTALILLFILKIASIGFGQLVHEALRHTVENGQLVQTSRKTSVETTEKGTIITHKLRQTILNENYDPSIHPDLGVIHQTLSLDGNQSKKYWAIDANQFDQEQAANSAQSNIQQGTSVNGIVSGGEHNGQPYNDLTHASGHGHEAIYSGMPLDPTTGQPLNPQNGYASQHQGYEHAAYSGISLDPTTGQPMHNGYASQHQGYGHAAYSGMTIDPITGQPMHNGYASQHQHYENEAAYSGMALDPITGQPMHNGYATHHQGNGHSVYSDMIVDPTTGQPYNDSAYHNLRRRSRAQARRHSVTGLGMTHHRHDSQYDDYLAREYRSPHRSHRSHSSSDTESESTVVESGTSSGVTVKSSVQNGKVVHVITHDQLDPNISVDSVVNEIGENLRQNGKNLRRSQSVDSGMTLSEGYDQSELYHNGHSQTKEYPMDPQMMRHQGNMMEYGGDMNPQIMGHPNDHTHNPFIAQKGYGGNMHASMAQSEYAGNMGMGHHASMAQSEYGGNMGMEHHASMAQSEYGGGMGMEHAHMAHSEYGGDMGMGHHAHMAQYGGGTGSKITEHSYHQMEAYGGNMDPSMMGYDQSMGHQSNSMHRGMMPSGGHSRHP